MTVHAIDVHWFRKKLGTWRNWNRFPWIGSFNYVYYIFTLLFDCEAKFEKKSVRITFLQPWLIQRRRWLRMDAG